MSVEIRLHEGESQDSPMRRFQRMIQMGDILSEAEANRHFISKREAVRIKAKK